MHTAEKLIFAIRHNPFLERANLLWNVLRPVYDRLTAVTGRKGIERIINGTDKVLLAPRWRMVSEEYEPDVWDRLIKEIKPGDVAADVGAYIGLYAITLAKRVGPSGSVVAFEPDVKSFASLKEHVTLNAMSDRIELRQQAVGLNAGKLEFVAQSSALSCVSELNSQTARSITSVECVSLDEVFAGKHLDVLKVDVEGYEEKVLAGASTLLQDKARSPRVIFIEVHPYAWEAIGTTSASLLGRLNDYGYQVRDMSDNVVSSIDEYGEVIAYKKSAGTSPFQT